MARTNLPGFLEFQQGEGFLRTLGKPNQLPVWLSHSVPSLACNMRYAWDVDARLRVFEFDRTQDMVSEH